MKVLTLMPIAVVVFLALATDGTNAQIGEQIGDLAKKFLPEWMTNNLATLMGPTQPPEKRLLLKLNGAGGFYIRKVPTRGLVSRPSKVYVKYAAPPGQNYLNMYRPPMNYINHPYQFERIVAKPHMEYVFEKPSIPIAYQPPAPHPYYPPPPTPTFENGPIHTIPAPNLGGLAQGSHANEQVYQNQPIYYPQVQVQQHEPQVQYQQQQQHYQVTEDATNDVTVFDPFTGRQKLYAPDPDPSLPTKRLPIEVNPLSKPTINQQLPPDVVKYDLLENNDLSAKLQEHIKHQQELLQANPTAYNPTFLVTQSNNLLEQYQNQQQLPVVQLFKPEQQQQHSFHVDQHHQFNVASPGQIHASQLSDASHNENSVEAQHFTGSPASYNHPQGNAPGSYQYIFNDFSNQHHPKAENQFSVTHQQDYPYQLQQSILGDKLAVGSENIKIYVPENYGIQSRSDESEHSNIYTNHKRQYTEITRTPAPVREDTDEDSEDVEYENQ